MARPEPVLASLPYETMSFLPLFVAREAGLFRDEGIDVDYVYVLGGGERGHKRKAVDLCISGAAPVVGGVSVAVEAHVQGWGDLKALAASSTRGSAMYARAGIETVEDLRGRRVMVGGGASRNELLSLAAGQGWEVGRDIVLVDGDEVERRNAFADPAVDAVAGRAQYRAYADKYGFHAFALPGAVWHEGGIAVAAGLIEQEPEAVQALVTAFVRAIDFIELNRADSIRIAVRNIRWLDEDGAAAQYDVANFDPRITDEGLAWMARLLSTAKGAGTVPPPHELADPRFLDRVRSVAG